MTGNKGPTRTRRRAITPGVGKVYRASKRSRGAALVRLSRHRPTTGSNGQEHATGIPGGASGSPRGTGRKAPPWRARLPAGARAPRRAEAVIHRLRCAAEASRGHPAPATAPTPPTRAGVTRGAAGTPTGRRAASSGPKPGGMVLDHPKAETNAAGVPTRRGSEGATTTTTPKRAGTAFTAPTPGHMAPDRTYYISPRPPPAPP